MLRENAECTEAMDANWENKMDEDPAKQSNKSMGEIEFPGLKLRLPQISLNLLILGIVLIAALWTPTVAGLTPGGEKLYENVVFATAKLYYGPSGAKKETDFLKTFVFWVPQQTNENTDFPRMYFEQLEEWLGKNFGGWTKWKVEGGGYSKESKKMSETGWFYQASLAKDKPDVEAKDIYRILKETFHQNHLYIIETPHDNR